jgi:hypothetical protein
MGKKDKLVALILCRDSEHERVKKESFSLIGDAKADAEGVAIITFASHCVFGKVTTVCEFGLAVSSSLFE